MLIWFKKKKAVVTCMYIFHISLLKDSVRNTWVYFQKIIFPKNSLHDLNRRMGK